MKRLLCVAFAVMTGGCVADVESGGEGGAFSAAPENEPLAPIKWVIKCDIKGMACMAQCAGEGINCAAGRDHPHKPDVGNGELAACARVGVSTCAFDYTNGERCVFFGGIPRPVCGVSP